MSNKVPYTYYIGVDPGKSGGLAVITPGGSVKVTVMPIAGDEVSIAALADWVRKYCMNDMCVTHACIEKVHAMPKQGVTSMFKFGFVTGVVHGVLGTYRIPIHLVTPHAWKSKVLKGTKKDKAAAAAYCSRVYPDVNLLATERSRKPHSGMADALCIARYAQLTVGIDR